MKPIIADLKKPSDKAAVKEESEDEEYSEYDDEEESEKSPVKNSKA